MSDENTNWPPILIIVQLKDGNVDQVEIANKAEAELAIAEIAVDPEVHSWFMYEQIKSSYPSQPSTDGQR